MQAVEIRFESPYKAGYKKCLGPGQSLSDEQHALRMPGVPVKLGKTNSQLNGDI